MLVRLLGREQEAKAGAWDLPFTDVPEWARPYVGYAYANGLTNGIGAGRFGSGQAVTADQYMTFLLRALGYSSETDFAWNAAADYGAGLGLKIADRKSFTRGQVAAVSAAALAQKQKGAPQTLAALLAELGRRTGSNLVVDDSVREREVSLSLDNLTIDEAFKGIAGASGLAMSVIDGTYMVSDGAPSDLATYHLSSTE